MVLQRDLLKVHSRLVADRQKFRVLRSWQWAGRTVPLVSCQHDSLMVLFCLILDSYLCHPMPSYANVVVSCIIKYEHDCREFLGSIWFRMGDCQTGFVEFLEG